MSKDSLLGIVGLLVFQINGKEYCADINHVSVVLNLNKQNMRGFQQEKGSLVFQDQMYKIIDIHEVLKDDNSQFTFRSKLILFKAFGIHFGFIADRIVEIITIDSSFVENSLDFIPYDNGVFICGELVIRDRRILFLDFKKLSRNLSSLNMLKVPAFG